MEGLRSLGLRAILAAGAATFVLAIPAPASAANFTVNTLADSAGTTPVPNTCTTGGTCELRWAIDAANAGSSADTITFAVTGTISLRLFSGPLPAIVEDLTIQGPGASALTIDGTNLDPVNASNESALISNNTGAETTISGLTISGHQFSKSSASMAGIPQAAGVANGGDLTLNRVTVMHNANTATSGNAATVRGAGVSTLGSGSVLRLVESTVSGNTASAGATSSMFATGAGVAQSQGGALEITRSTIEGNSVSASANNAGSSATAAGAGVRTDLSSGLTTITGSTISGNTATARGASTSTAQGGGIRDENTSAAVDIRGSTLASNTVAIGSGGGGPSLDGANASFAAGIPAATEFSDSILADPVGAGSCSATHPFSGGYNLDSENTCGFDTLVSGDVFNADPMLGPLADNGGPTQTRGLLPGSAAIDQGLVGAGETTDQRGTGYVRVFDQPAVSPLTGGDESDIGAFELQVPAAPTFTGTDPGSGSNLNTPKVRGSAPTDSTVQLYTNAACTSGIGSPAPAATFAAPGIPVSVADNSTTTFFAKASLPGAGGTSACSPTSITYAEVTPVPLPGGGSGAAGGGGGQAAPSPVVPTKCKKGQKLKRGKCVKQKRKKKK